MIKVVVFDLGKVLLNFDYSVAARQLAARSARSAEEITLHLAGSPLLYDYEKGLLTKHQFFDEICNVSGFRGSIEEFADSFSDIFTPIKPMVDLQIALRQRGMPTYIFSNTNELAVEHIRSHFPFFSHFDGYILSYEHRSLKPEARIYEVVERQSGRSGAQILYLDDRPENIEAAAARGWQVILQEDPEKSCAVIQKLGLLNHSDT